MKIVQVLPTISYGDAVGNDAIAIKRLIEERGLETQIYAESIDPRLPAGTALPVSEIPLFSKEDIIIFHESVGTDLNTWIQAQGCRKVMVYHNITPPEFFLRYDEHLAAGYCRSGLEQVQKLTGAFEMVLSDSAFNRQNLLDMGFACPNHVLPILIPFDDYKEPPSQAVIEKYSGDGFINIIFVGRVAPNKCQEDVISAFSEYQHHYNAKSRLFVVGRHGGRYIECLQRYTKQLGARNVVFTGHCRFDEILAYYHLADLFLCQSEHEGFCVPLVEAMYFDVPIVAYDSSAVGETLGGSGFLLKEKNPLVTAGVMDRILSDDALRRTIIGNQRERLADFQYGRVKELFWKYMDCFTTGKGRKEKVCFVVQRYGLEVNGGSELHCRLLTERMKKYYDVEVLSTKAIDYMTWKNEYTHNVEYINDVLVRRFGVGHPRDQDVFNVVNELFMKDQLPVDREAEWMEKQGPYVPSLVSYLKEHQYEYKAVIFFTYLYYTTAIGVKAVDKNIIMIPTAHDEPFLRMKIFDDVFLKPDAFFFNTEEERKLVNGKYDNGHIPYALGGTGVDLPESINAGRFKEKYQIENYIVYVGRVDYGKNCDELFEFFAKYKKRRPGGLKLVLIGKNMMPVPQSEEIQSLGFVSDEDKFDGIAGAKVLVLPSKFESLSMVVLEAMAVRTPVIVNGTCDVLKAHCTKSNGGFYYTDYAGFEEKLDYLLDSENEEAVSKMKENAKRYVDENYQWDSITSRLHDLIEEVCVK